MSSYLRELKSQKRIYYVGNNTIEVIIYPNGTMTKPANMDELSTYQLKAYIMFDTILAKAVQTRVEFEELKFKLPNLGYNFDTLARRAYDKKFTPEQLKAYILRTEKAFWLRRG